jgi:8-amino-7-oxononanoate synthase
LSINKSIQNALGRLDAQGQRRSLRALPGAGGVIDDGGQRVVNLSSNDYLDLSNDPRVVKGAQEAVERFGCGATASRLMSGNLTIHDAFEKRLAALVGQEACLIFPSGFQTNLGVISTLMSEGDVIFSDELNHASIIDGARLAKAEVCVYRHNDVEHLNELLTSHPVGGRRLVVSDSVFSMDGDLADVVSLERLAREFDALLMIDEAHGIGVFGEGAGLCKQLGVRPDIVSGTMSKSLGTGGGFVAMSAELRDYLINVARPFIFSTGISPANVGAALAAVDVIESERGMGAELLSRAGVFHGLLRDAGLDVGDSASQVIPLMVGENDAAVRLSAELLEQNLLAVAIRPPSVPEGTARLRLSVTLAHSAEMLETAAGVIVERFSAVDGVRA